MAQVKFYSVGTDAEKSDANGIYFVNGGELYKGTSRFGANKVWNVPSTGQDAEGYNLASALTAAGVTGAIGGDILTGFGAAKVFNGTTWVDLGADTAITDDLESRVSAIETVVSVGSESSTVTADTVTADTGVFTNLTVSDTATFSATTVSATTLTVDGVAVSNIAATDASDNDAGIAVTVSTANGGVTGVDVVVTSATLLTSLALSDFSGKSLVTALGPSEGTGAATDDQVPTALAVAKKLATLDNAMHFREVVASTGAISDPAKGDIVVIGANPASGFVAGQEYIYDGTNWELIGDQRTYAVNAYTSTASVYSGVENVPGALNAVGAAADTFQAALDAKATIADEVSDANKASDLVTAGAVVDYVTQEIEGLGTAASKNFADTLTSTGTSLPTESAVASYVTGVIDALAGSASDVDKGVSVDVVTADGEVSSVDVSVTAASTMAFGAAGSADELATTAAVKSYFDNNLVWLDASGAAIA